MNRRTTAVLFLIACALASTRASSAQESGSRVVELYTNAPNASVYIDDALAGRASQRYFAVARDSETIRLVVGGRENWSVPPVSAQLPEASQSDTVSIRVNFPYRYRFESKPFGARVLSGAEEVLMGLTPFETMTDVPLSGPVT
ncbi:MAG: hypothetical protein KJO98_16870, partial [Rhodothermia bacterium]|nr:hypothetical protein [Rhodothermia bacterium]